MDLHKQVPRGAFFPKDYKGEAILIGMGVCVCSRAQFFNTDKGLGVRVTHRVGWEAPPLHSLLTDTHTHTHTHTYAEESSTDTSTALLPQPLLPTTHTDTDRHTHTPTQMEGWIYAQNLSSLVVAHVLSPQPGACVLDMCAAPGGKSTHLCALMQGKGMVIACDRSKKKVCVCVCVCVCVFIISASVSISFSYPFSLTHTHTHTYTHTQVRELAQLGQKMGMSECLIPLVMDTTKCVCACVRVKKIKEKEEKEGEKEVNTHTHTSTHPRSILSSLPTDTKDHTTIYLFPKHPKNKQTHTHTHTHTFHPETFDHILLDPPCSALGLRPRFVLECVRVCELDSHVTYQKAFWWSAVQLLKVCVCVCVCVSL